MSRATLRPFVRVASYRQTHAATLLRPKLDTLALLGDLKLINLGNTPAYEVNFHFKSDKWTCTSVKPFDLSQRETITVRMTCEAKAAPKPNTLSLDYVKGYATYRDGYGTHYSEDSMKLRLRIGEPLDHPFFELNQEPIP